MTTRCNIPCIAYTTQLAIDRDYYNEKMVAIEIYGVAYEIIDGSTRYLLDPKNLVKTALK